MDEDEKKPDFYTVSVFLVDRAYGGPEEGGWWYDTGTPCTEIFEELGTYKLPQITTDKEYAFARRKVMQQLLDATLNVGRPSIGSSISRGKYRAVVSDNFPVAYPAERPRYE